MRGLALLSALALLCAAPVAAQREPTLVSDLSQSRIDIAYSFVGAELLLFGAIRYPGGRTPDDEPGIAVVVRGPAEPITIRKKSKVAGIWMNTESARFETAPGFYAAATSAPIRDLVDERTAAIFEIGLDHLQLSPASSSSPEEARDFIAGLLDLRTRAGLYAEDEDAVTIAEKTLYRAPIRLPAEVPIGTYSAEIYLIRDGEVVATSEREIEIDKTGFERAVYVAAQERELAYGLTAVALALLAGWLAGAVVRR